MKNASAGTGLWRSVRRLSAALALALLGLAVARIVTAADRGGDPIYRLAHSPGYGSLITTLLAVGLFASAYGISRKELRRNARVVIVAITLGVAVKAALTGSIMALAFGSAAYVMLGVAVAQIDPLSVAAMLRDSSMSGRAQSVLSAWASFDDPITVLLVVYLASFTLHAAGTGGRSAGTLIAGAGSYLDQAMRNLVLVAAAAAIWYVLTAAGRKRPDSRLLSPVMYVCLAGLIAAAVRFDLLLGITVCGLFFRPRAEALISRLVGIAFYAATFLLGMLLITGTHLWAGLLLGGSAFAVQILAGAVISHGMPRPDRVHLALGQQNGITAIILALALQPYLPEAVGIIAIAIFVTNILNIVSNGLWDRHLMNDRASHAQRLQPIAPVPSPAALPGSGDCVKEEKHVWTRVSG
jgi:NhaP-type Na+/H+ or K+/H+ antiporter